MILIINILISLFICIITIIGYNKLKKPKIVYKYPNIDKYKDIILNKIFKHQQNYAWKAEDIYREIDAVKTGKMRIDNKSYMHAIKEYSKFEGMSLICQELIKEIENIEDYEK